MNQGERKLCEYIEGMSGSFYKSLFKAIFAADSINQAKLKTGFPEEVEATIRYSTEDGYFEKLLDGPRV